MERVGKAKVDLVTVMVMLVWITIVAEGWSGASDQGDDHDDMIISFAAAEAEAEAEAVVEDSISKSGNGKVMINAKVYRCSDGCVKKCGGVAENFNKYANCTTTCMEPCVKSLVDVVYRCTFGCTKSTLSTNSATSMDEVEGHIASCYNNCKKDNF